MSQTLDAVLSKGQTMPERNRFPAVLEPFVKSKRAQTDTDYETWKSGEVSPTLNHFDSGETRATTVVAHTSDGVVADPITAAEGKSWTNEGTTFRLRNCVQQATPVEGWHELKDSIVREFEHQVQRTLDIDFESWADEEYWAVIAYAALAMLPRPVAVEAIRDAVAAAIKWSEGDAAWPDPASERAEAREGDAEAFNIREDAQAGNFSCTPADTSIALKRHLPGPTSHHSQMLVRQSMAVRRLTPLECERLQGFPDGWTQIAWKRKAAEECPDGPRYRALGNSMAVPVMRWLGERIAAVESILIADAVCPECGDDEKAEGLSGCMNCVEAEPDRDWIAAHPTQEREA